VGQTTTGRNVAAIPYNWGQTYAPKTAVGVIEETHIFTPNIVNQFKYGYARYNGPTFDADQLPQYSATTMGITNLPGGAAQGAFPITTFAGTNAPTGWAGTTPSVTVAANYTLLDNLQWVKGRHTLTLGGQSAWMLYNVVNATGGSTPLTLANAVAETAQLNYGFSALANTGASYASFLVGEIDKASLTQYLQSEFGARFRAISPYFQDNWKVTDKLTLDLGVRYDFFPTVHEVHNAGSYFDPTVTNPVTGLKGALQFTGTGTNTCNCSTPVNNSYKNFGPRLGLAYQIDPKTVIHASYGIMFTHGNAVGGSATSLGTLG
jgi:outer membrane receptor protein involved in Fe transport